MAPKRLRLYHGVSDPLAAFGTVCGMVFPVLMFPAAIVYALAELLIPELARCTAAGSQTRVKYLVKKSLHVVLIFSCLCCGIEFLLAGDLTAKLYQSREAGQYLRLYALMIPMLYCDAITDAMTKGLGQQTACVRYNILTSALDVVFLFLLLPRQGMNGYYFSFLITHLINFLLSLRRLLKTATVKIDWTEPLLALLCIGIGVWSAGSIGHPLLKAAAFIVIFLCLSVLTGIIGKRDIIWFQGLVKTASKP
jgi:stage V sporulation protein B